MTKKEEKSYQKEDREKKETLLR